MSYRDTENSIKSRRLFAVSNHSTIVGGGERSFLDLLSNLPALWSTIAVVPKEGELLTVLEKRGIKTQVILLPPIRPWHALSILSALRTHLRLCRRHRPDLIYANGSRAAFYGGIIGRILNLPVIWHCRIADSDLYLDFILRRLCSRIIANSHATANRFKQNFRSKVTVIYNGVDMGWLRDDSVRKPELIDEDWKVILVVARISRSKRHDLALAAFEQIAAKHPNAHLIFVGPSDALDSDWSNYLKRKSHQSTFSNRIHWIEQVDDIRPWYKSAHTLVLPSENEAFGRVLVEAMAMGLPVISTRSGGVPEIVRHHQDGILVAPGNVDEFASAMSEISKNDSLREQLARSAKKRADNFSLELHVTRMINVFEDTIGNSNSRFPISFK